MADNEFIPVTPGEMLKEEFLKEYGLSQSQLAKAVGISPNRIAEIVNNRRRITADTALRLASQPSSNARLHSCSGRSELICHLCSSELAG
jgi:addiction module HigA family antidote